MSLGTTATLPEGTPAGGANGATAPATNPQAGQTGGGASDVVSKQVQDVLSSEVIANNGWLL